jgi:two-component system chemotaxis response regulator CheB
MSSATATRVVVADDSRLMRRVLSGTLTEAGFDLNMPGTDGMAVLRALRNEEAPSTSSRRTVVIACSTGGPRALASVAPALPAPLGAGTLIVQHMPAGFTGSLAARLDREARLTVREATGGEALRPGTALLAPGGSHLRVDAQRVVHLSDAPPIGALRPRADLTIADAAALFGSDLLLVVLTGMGKDGLQGAQAVRRAGGRILVEAAETCTVYGMPRAVAEAGLADAVLPIHQLRDAIVLEAGA